MSLSDTSTVFYKPPWKYPFGMAVFPLTKRGRENCLPQSMMPARALLVGRLPCQSIRQGFVSLVIYDIEGNGQKDNMGGGSGGGGMARKPWECQGAVLKPKWVLQL